MSVLKEKAKVIMLPTALPPYKMPYSENIPKSNLILGLEESLNYSKKLGFANDAGQDDSLLSHYGGIFKDAKDWIKENL